MHRWHLVATALLCTLVFDGCRKNAAQASGSAAPPEVGVLYSLNDGEGGFRAGKVIAFEEGMVFVRWFGTRWTSRPKLAEAQNAGKASSIAFSLETFAGMQPVPLEKETVSPEDLEAYEGWKQSARDIF